MRKVVPSKWLRVQRLLRVPQVLQVLQVLQGKAQHPAPMWRNNHKRKSSNREWQLQQYPRTHLLLLLVRLVRLLPGQQRRLL